MRRVSGVLLLLATALAGCAHLKYNLRPVENGLYRSGQMPAPWLGKLIETEGIRTVVSLRQITASDAWYPAEIDACARQGVAHYNLSWTMTRPPDPDSLAHYLAILDTAPRPILVHCQMGTHRAGTAAALHCLYEAETPDEARKQFTLLFLDAPIGEIVDWYEESGEAMAFPEWAREVYPHIYRARVKP